MPDGLLQREMAAVEEDAELVHQEHGVALRRAGHFGEHLGMADIGFLRRLEGLLVDRGSGHPGGRTGHAEFHGFPDIGYRGFPAQGGYLPDREVSKAGYHAEVHHGKFVRGPGNGGGFIYPAELRRKGELFAHRLQDGEVADEERDAFFPDVRVRHGPKGDFRANPGGVAHGYRDHSRFHFDQFLSFLSHWTAR